MERCTLEKNCFIGIFFEGRKSPEKVIIAAGGAMCDEKNSVCMSRYMRKAGYNVLVLGFYKWKGLSKHLVSIPVDYVEKAVKWLKKEKGFQKIAMTGISTGAGYTLLAASLIPDISCVIPIVPYDYAMLGTYQSVFGFRSAHRSQYTWHGKDLPYTDSDILEKLGMLGWLNGVRKAEGYGLSRFMRYGYDLLDKKQIPQARIRVENMHADVLFLAAKNDDCWPSDVAVPRMVSILKEANYPYRVESHIYEKGSHALSDGLDTMTGFARFALNHMIPTEKKYPKECEEARRDSFRRVLKFLKEW